jgi:Sulfotransferase domain
MSGGNSPPLIHTLRSEEQWWKSFSNTIAALLTSSDPGPAPPHIRTMMEVAAQFIGPQMLGGDRETALMAYRRRTEQVRAAIPSERLLVFNVAEGWEPLCRFLGVPVPGTPFPRANSTEEFWKLVKGELH